MKSKDVFWVFMDSGKTFDIIDSEGDCVEVVWAGGRLLKRVESFYVNSIVCVRVGNNASDWFPGKVGLRQGCVLSPWLFNIDMDGVVREVNARVLGGGVSLLSENDRNGI